uniref:Uncharacterized protein n=1 Tax=Eutreptiella gymnastica TaxID=73025 RepID=A0A7S4LPJ3_9EUGL
MGTLGTAMSHVSFQRSQCKITASKLDEVLGHCCALSENPNDKTPMMMRRWFHTRALQLFYAPTLRAVPQMARRGNAGTVEPRDTKSNRKLQGPWSELPFAHWCCN